MPIQFAQKNLSQRVSHHKVCLIAVLIAGRIAELGTHDELLARNGHYASLFQKQLLEEELSVTS